jgi:hypothetical protein
LPPRRLHQADGHQHRCAQSSVHLEVHEPG